MSDNRPLVPHPCHESWEHLTPAQRGHFCEVCETKVYNLSAMTKAEADAFLASRGDEDTCVSYRESPTGAVEYRPTPLIPLARLARRLPAAAGFSLALAACSPGEEAKSKEPATDQDKADAPADPKPEPEPEPEPEPTPEPTPDPETDADAEPTAPPIDRPPHVKGKWERVDPPEAERPKPDPESTRKGRVAKPD